MPTGWPSTRPKPVMMFGANRAWVSRNSPSSSTCSIAVCMSYGWFAESGMSVSSSRSSSVVARSASSGKDGASERLFDGRYDSSDLTYSMASFSSPAMWCATPEVVLCVRAPPSSSNPTSSPVTVLMTSGPVMNMCEVWSTITVKSVIAGE